MEILPPSHRHRPAEGGYVMLVAIFLMALLTLALSLAAPVVIRQLQLDRERETMQRGKQYRRAVQLYFRKFHAYPPSVSALEMTNNTRFLRRKYIDPMTGKDDWRPVLFGQNKTPAAMGFFGQPLAGSGSTLAGIGPGGGNSSSGGALPGGISDIFGGPTSGGTSTSGPSGSGSDTTVGVFGGTGGGSASSNSTAPVGSSNGGLGSSSGSDQSGPAFGGAGIIGFSPASTKQSIMVYKKKNHFDEWEFTYDPLGDPTLSQGNGAALPQPGSSLVGNGTGPGGTGPVMNPNPGAPAPNNPTQ